MSDRKFIVFVLVLAMLAALCSNVNAQVKWQVTGCTVTYNNTGQDVPVKTGKDYLILLDMEKDVVSVQNAQGSTFTIQSLIDAKMIDGVDVRYYSVVDEEYISCIMAMCITQKRHRRELLVMAIYSDISVTWIAKPFILQRKKEIVI